jgi:hypothetical protein|uniref:Uncharacterized protein n=2 Tax=Oryza TaxID=4527 RepID=Q7XJ07_ORYSJ|nr:hypothetical protein [Oryza sativa Japonica Group]
MAQHYSNAMQSCVREIVVLAELVAARADRVSLPSKRLVILAMISTFLHVDGIALAGGIVRLLQVVEYVLM